MAVLKRNGFRRDMSCQYTTVQIGDVPNVLGELRSSASAILSCSNGASPATSGSSNKPGSSTLSGSLPASSTIKPPISSTQPLAISSSAQVTSSQSQPSTPSTINIPKTVSSPAPTLGTSSSSQTAASSISNQPRSTITNTANPFQQSFQPSSTLSLQIVTTSAIGSQISSDSSPLSSPTFSTPPTTLATSTQLITSSLSQSSTPTPSQSLQSTSPISTTQPASSSSSLQSPTSISTSVTQSSSLLLDATLRSSRTAPTAAPSLQSPSSSPDGAFSGGGSTLGPESTEGGITTKGGIILGVIIPLVLIIGALLTVFICRRNRKKQHRQSLGYMSTVPKSKPWKRNEVKRQNSNFRTTIANSEGLMDIGAVDRTSRKPMRERAVQFPVLGYGKDSAPRLPAIPGQAFAPQQANRSSSVYSKDLFNNLTGERSPRRPHMPWGFTEEILFMTSTSPPLEKPTQSLEPVVNTVLLPDVYIAEDATKNRNTSVYKQASSDKNRDSAIGGLSPTLSKLNNNKPLPLFSSPSSQLPQSPSQSSTPRTSSTLLPTPSLTRPDSTSAFSESSTYSTQLPLQPLLTTLDTTSTPSPGLNISHQIGYSPSREFGYMKGLDFEFKSLSPGFMPMQKPMPVSKPPQAKMEGGGSKLKNEFVLVVGERDSSLNSVSSRESVLGELEKEWEKDVERAVESERERGRERSYRGGIKPGMGVQRTLGSWALGVQKRWTGRDS